MTYGDRLRRWIVVRLSPNFQHLDVARFHKFSDAEGYQQTLSRLNPAERYEIMFDSADLTPKPIDQPEPPLQNSDISNRSRVFKHSRARRSR